MSIKAIIFDFDGVLVESVDIKTRAFARLFENEGPEEARKVVDYHIKNMGVSRFDKFRYIYSEILRKPLPEEQFKNLCERFSRLVVDEVVTSDWVPGARVFLEENHKQYALFVVSATPEEELKEIIHRREMEHYFMSVFGSPAKKSELIRNILNTNGYKRESTIFIGDAIADWEASQETSVNFIARIRSLEENPFSGLNITCMHDLTGLKECLEREINKTMKSRIY